MTARKNPHAVALGRRGGKVTSEAKAAAARANGRKRKLDTAEKTFFRREWENLMQAYEPPTPRHAPPERETHPLIRPKKR